MVFLLDLAVILIAFLTIYFVVKKGFVHSLMDLLSFVGAIIIAKIFSSSVSQVFYKILHGVVSPKIEAAIAEIAYSGDIPDYLQAESLQKMISDYGLDFFNTGATADMLSDSVTVLLAFFLAYTVLFLGVSLLFKILTPLVCSLFRLPVLKTANKILSYLFGILLAGVYLLVFASLMQVAFPFLCSLYPESLSAEMVDKTYLFGYLYNLEWVKIFLGKI